MKKFLHGELKDPEFRHHYEEADKKAESRRIQDAFRTALQKSKRAKRV